MFYTFLKIKEKTDMCSSKFWSTRVVLWITTTAVIVRFHRACLTHGGKGVVCVCV